MSYCSAHLLLASAPLLPLVPALSIVVKDNRGFCKKNFFLSMASFSLIVAHRAFCFYRTITMNNSGKYQTNTIKNALDNSNGEIDSIFNVLQYKITLEIVCLI